MSLSNNTIAFGKPPYRVGRTLLPNGLRVVAVETPHLHSATVCLYVRAGSREGRHGAVEGSGIAMMS